MKEVVKENHFALDRSMEECCSIAESMIEEIHQISMPEYNMAPSANRRHRGSLTEKLLRRIRAARSVTLV